VLAGNEAYLSEHGISGGGAGILVAIDGRLAGNLTVADPIRAGAPGAVLEIPANGARGSPAERRPARTAEAIAKRRDFARGRGRAPGRQGR